MAVLLSLAQVGQAQPAAPAVASASGAPVRASRLIHLADDAVGYIPASAGTHPPLLVLLHGAGHRNLEMVQHFEGEADARGVVLLAPASRGVTWDSVSLAEEPPSLSSPLANMQARRFSNSGDAKRVEAVIAALAEIVPVDRTRTVLAGFSDGATYALAMGMSRDHTFSAVIAWSPGIALETANPARGRRVLISHGRHDPILDFNVTCAEIVPLVHSEHAAVTFMPFDGGHEVPDAVKDAFLDAVLGPVPGAPTHPLPATVQTCIATPPWLPSM